MAITGSAVIVGAGIGGLTAALALRRHGWSVRLYEREPALSEVGAGITLWRNALAALDGIGAAAAVAAAGAEAQAEIVATSGGAVLLSGLDFEPIARHVPRPVLLAYHRMGLQRALHAQLPDGAVTFGARFVRFDSAPGVAGGARVIAHFDGHDSAAADLLVGADGVASAVRAQLLGDGEPRYAGYTAWRGITATPPGWLGPAGEFWGAGDRFGLVPIPERRLYWYAVVTSPPRVAVSPVDQKARLLERFDGYAFGVPEIIAATPAEAILHNDIVDRPPADRWSAGRVTLLGDAAHPTTPNLGQGAAMAIESSVVLARCLAAHDSLSAALAAYEATRRPRTSYVTEASWRLGRVAQWRNPALRALRRALVAWTPASVQLRPVIRLASHDASTCALASPAETPGDGQD
jgi:2-polyprenyl-6-methoxyphenol hydroxylase-like FAD-dependent oxidoreductase